MINIKALIKLCRLKKERRRVLRSYNATRSQGLTHTIQMINLLIYLKHTAKQIRRTMKLLIETRK